MENQSTKRNQERSIELSSEKVRNIIGQIPPALLRYGAAIISAVLVVFVSISAYIPYQEIIPIEITVNTTPKVEEITAASPGVFIPNECLRLKAEKGDTVGYIYHSDALQPVIAPIAGKVILNIESNIHINCGELIGIVVPDNSVYYYGETQISADDKRKVSINQKVIIETYGTDEIVGYFTEISSLCSSNGMYDVIIGLGKNASLTPLSKMRGRVIIAETTILNRFVDSLKIKE